MLHFQPPEPLGRRYRSIRARLLNSFIHQTVRRLSSDLPPSDCSTLSHKLLLLYCNHVHLCHTCCISQAALFMSLFGCQRFALSLSPLGEICFGERGLDHTDPLHSSSPPQNNKYIHGLIKTLFRMSKKQKNTIEPNTYICNHKIKKTPR